MIAACCHPNSIPVGESVTKYGNIFIKVVDGLNKIAELAYAILDLLAYALDSVTTAVQSVAWSSCFTALRTIADVTAFINIVKRVKEWFNPKNWNTTSGFAALFSMSSANVMSAVNTLNKFALISLGRAALVLTKVTDVLYIGALLCDIWHTIKGIDGSKKQKGIEKSRELSWEDRKAKLDGSQREQILKEIDSKLVSRVEHWGDKASAKFNSGDVATYLDAINTAREREVIPKKEDRAIIRKLKEWQDVKTVFDNARTSNNIDEIKNICDYKISKLQTRTFNENLSIKQGWANVAIDVAFIALFILGLVLPLYMGAGPILPVILSSVTAAFADKGGYIAQLIYGKRDLPIWDKFKLPEDQEFIPKDNNSYQLLTQR